MRRSLGAAGGRVYCFAEMRKVIRMGLWQIDTDTLARSRFVLSPFAETFASLKLLHAGTGAHPGEEAWLRTHLPGYRARLAADPVAALLVQAAIGTSWIADFFCPTSCVGESFEETVARVREAGAGEARANLRVSLRGPLPAALERDDLPERATALLTYVWEETVRPYWEQPAAHPGGRRGRADRAREPGRLGGRARLAEAGDAVARGEPVPGQPARVSAAGDRRRGRAAVHAGHAEDQLGVLGGTGAVRRRLPVPRGARRGPRPAAPPGRARGAHRDRAGRTADAARDSLSTTQLVAVTGQGLGSVGRHLRVLLDAGLVERRRAGRSVLYVRTAAGEVLVEASGAAGTGPLTVA